MDGKAAGSKICAIRELLAKTKNFLNAKDVCRQDGRDFNVFRLCTVDHYEALHSRIIAEFLNPRGAHGKNDLFLRLFFGVPKVAEFLTRNGFPAPNDFGCLDSAMVGVEEWFSDGRCDITIHWRGWCIIIENKIYAADQSGQLKRYEQAVYRTGEKPLLFYLTLDGHSASIDSADEIDYCRISYRDDIAQWLEECAQKTQDCPYVHEPLKQYIKLVKELAGSPEEQNMNKEIIQEITLSPEMFKAACQVGALMQDARLKIAKEIMKSLREELATRPIFEGWMLKDGLEFLLKENSRYNGFWLERINGDKPYYPYCEFQARGALFDMFVGLVREEGKQGEALAFLRAAEKSAKLTLKYTFYTKESQWWIYGCYPHDKEMRTWSDDLLAQLIDAELRKQFAGKIANCLQCLLEEAAEVDKGLRA